MLILEAHIKKLFALMQQLQQNILLLQKSIAKEPGCFKLHFHKPNHLKHLDTILVSLTADFPLLKLN